MIVREEVASHGFSHDTGTDPSDSLVLGFHFVILGYVNNFAFLGYAFKLNRDSLCLGIRIIRKSSKESARFERDIIKSHLRVLGEIYAVDCWEIKEIAWYLVMCDLDLIMDRKKLAYCED